MCPLQWQGSRRDQMRVEAEIGWERDLESSVLQVAFSFRVYDSRSFQRRGSWCRGFRQYGHRSGPYADDSERKLRSLKHFRSIGQQTRAKEITERAMRP